MDNGEAENQCVDAFWKYWENLISDLEAMSQSTNLHHAREEAELLAFCYIEQ